MKPILLLATIASILATVALVAANAPAPVELPPSGEIGLAHEHEAVTTPLTADEPDRPPRAAHIRAWASNGTLLHSTWPGEEGIYQYVDVADHPNGSIAWKGPDGLVGRRPLWEPIVAMLSLAPPNTTVRLSNYTVLETRLDEVVIPKVLDVPIEGVVSRAEADDAFGADRTAGSRVLFLGQIPVTILDVGDEVVRYRFELDAPLTLHIERSVGLVGSATPLPDVGALRIALSAPTGEFTTHNNCALTEKVIEPGHYVVREERGDSFVVHRYNNRFERLIEGEPIGLELTFQDDAVPPLTTEHDHH